MKVLLIRTDRIGDVVLSIPTIEAVKTAYPDSHITFLTRSQTAPLLLGNPHLDDILEYDPRGSLIRMRRVLKGAHFDAAVLLHPTLRLATLLFLSRIGRRIGTGFRPYSLLFNSRVYEHRRPSERHEADYNFSLLRPLGIGVKRSEPRMYLSEEERDWAESKLRSWGIGARGIVAIHPGSGGSARDWSIGSFASLGERISRELDTQVLVTGGPGEEPLVREVASLMKRNPLTLTGQNLRRLAAIFERCDLLVTNSTGPMHMAAAVGTPVVAIFCPIQACSPKRWGPLGEGHSVLFPPVPTCRKCTGPQCQYWDCMDLVTVDQVLERVSKMPEDSSR